jgi:hypothetical protein
MTPERKRPSVRKAQDASNIARINPARKLIRDLKGLAISGGAPILTGR